MIIFIYYAMFILYIIIILHTFVLCLCVLFQRRSTLNTFLSLITHNSNYNYNVREIRASASVCYIINRQQIRSHSHKLSQVTITITITITREFLGHMSHTCQMSVLCYVLWIFSFQVSVSGLLPVNKKLEL